MDRKELTKIREDMGLNKAEFAALIGVKPPYVSLLESGKRDITDAIRHKVSEVVNNSYTSKVTHTTDPIIESLEGAGLSILGRFKRLEARMSEMEKTMKGTTLRVK